MIRFACPACNKIYQAKDHLAGKKSVCKKCNAVVLIPEKQIQVIHYGKLLPANDVNQDERDPHNHKRQDASINPETPLHEVEDDSYFPRRHNRTSNNKWFLCSAVVISVLFTIISLRTCTQYKYINSIIGPAKDCTLPELCEFLLRNNIGNVVEYKSLDKMDSFPYSSGKHARTPAALIYGNRFVAIFECDDDLSAKHNAALGLGLASQGRFFHWGRFGFLTRDEETEKQIRSVLRIE